MNETESTGHIGYAENPNRCQHTGKTGQCNNLAVKLPNGDYGIFCQAHHGTAQVKAAEEASLRNYQLTRFKAKFERHAQSGKIKDLRDEIGILRMMLEDKINMCTDETDMLLQSGPISDLVLKIEKVVASCHKLEGSMGQLLDKQAILQFASEVISVISEEVKDATVLDNITTKIMGRLSNESIRDTEC